MKSRMVWVTEIGVEAEEELTSSGLEQLKELLHQEVERRGIDDPGSRVSFEPMSAEEVERMSGSGAKPGVWVRASGEFLKALAGKGVRVRQVVVVYGTIWVQ